MIVPVLNFFGSYRSAPVTWILVLANMALFLMTTTAQMERQAQLEDIYRTSNYLSTQGEVFSRIIIRRPDLYSSTLRELAKQGLEGDERSLLVLGQLAIRNSHFEDEFRRMPIVGDRVAQSRWLANYERVKLALNHHPSFLLGLNQANSSWPHWLSYQFMHSGLVHLAGNMFFLLLFGSALEPIVGGGMVFLVYLLAGAIGAGVFLLLAALTTAPLIGASGAVSGLMGLYSLLFWRRSVRFFYWLLPIRSYMGFIYLPAWVVLVMWVLSDLGGYLATMPEVGGVAYTAHLGGTLTGLIIGFTLKKLPQVSMAIESARS